MRFCNPLEGKEKVMPAPGDTYQKHLKEVHLNWGTLSTSGIRNRNPYEVYIPIPLREARRLNILQGSSYTAYSSDGTFICELYAGGSQGDMNEYGKNFESRGDLTILGKWLKDTCGAQPGDQVDISWLSETDVRITHTPS